MKYIITAIVLILLFTGLMWLVLDKQFVVDCKTWQRYEKEYPLFELDTQLVDECAKEGIIIE